MKKFKPEMPFHEWITRGSFYFLAAGMILFVSVLPSQGQTLYTVSGDQLIDGGSGSTTVRPNLEVTGTGGVLFGGTLGSGSIPVEGAGARMMWYPKKAAFRAGTVSSTQWDDANIGVRSFAFGWDAKASGSDSIALGKGGEATSEDSVAIGDNAKATAEDSFALGSFSEAPGEYGMALGSYSKAEGSFSLSLGGGYAFGDGSIAIGTSLAQGNGSIAIGSTGSYSLNSVTLGYWNVEDSSQDPENWISTDELVVIGNGLSAPSNALVMRKNANMRTGGSFETKGIIRCAPGGDLSMGAFTAGQNPATLNAGLKYSGE